MNLRKLPLAWFTEKIEQREPFAFSRWGDGEWSAILGHGHHNCDGQEYTPALREQLAVVLEDRPSYLLGMQSLALRRFGPEIEEWLEQRSLQFDWVNSNVFHGASIGGRLEMMLTALGERKIWGAVNGERFWKAETVLVGPARLERLEGVGVPIAYHVVIPDEDAFSSLEETVGHLEKELAWYQDRVVIVCAGMGSNIIIHRMAAQYPKATLIDFGSVFEPYCGHANRTYHRQVLERLRAEQEMATC